MPGSIIAMGRLNRPAIMVYGGTIHSGKWKGESLNIVSAFEALGKNLANTISDEDYKGVIKTLVPERCVRWDVHGKHDGFCD